MEHRSKFTCSETLTDLDWSTVCLGWGAFADCLLTLTLLLTAFSELIFTVGEARISTCLLICTVDLTSAGLLGFISAAEK